MIQTCECRSPHFLESPLTGINSISYESSVFQAGLHSTKPPFSFHPSDWESEAKRILSANSIGYVHGNAGAGSTYRKNLAAFDKWSIVPRRLRPSRADPETGHPAFADTTTTLKLGPGGHDDDELVVLPFPVAIAPIGVQKIFNPQGEIATARAAALLGIPYTLSTASSTSIEDVARAMDEAVAERSTCDEMQRSGHNHHQKKVHRWFQLYWPPNEHNDITASLLARAKKSGYSVLIVTLDTYVLGWRPSDMNNGYNPFLHPDRIGVEIGLTDPVFQAKFKKEHGYDIEEAGRHDSELTGHDLGKPAQEWAKIAFSGHSHRWEDIAFLQAHWDGPIVLKGIQSVADAIKAREVGVQGIVVSNHGGRQHDGGVGSLGVLPRIVDAVGGGHDKEDGLAVWFDSGVRCGADVMKAVALGAQCVLVGRPYAYGLAIGGEEGVRHVLRSICGDLMLNMHLAGLRGLDEVTRDILVKEDEV